MALFLALNIFFWRLSKCYDDVKFKSLIEYDLNGNQIISFLEFNDADWTNNTLFHSYLSNHAHLSMYLSTHESNNDLEYLVNIENWPWNESGNIIEFCFDVNSMDDINNIHLDSTNKIIMDITDDNCLHICHIVYNHYLKVAHSGHIYHNHKSHQHFDHDYESRMDDVDDINILFNSTDEYDFLLSTINDDNVINANVDDIDIDDEGDGDNANKFDLDHQHLPWLVGVFIAIGFVVCIFACLIIYLMKEGFFDDDQSQFIKNKKRKKSTMIIMDNRKRNISAQSHTSMANSAQSVSSPKKNLRINVTYHSPKESIPNTHDQDQDQDQDQDEDIHRTKIMINNIEFSKTRSITKRKSITCESTRIIHGLSCDLEGSALIAIHEDIEAEEEDDLEDDDNGHHVTLSMGTPTITVNSTNDESESEFESMVQYVITCSNENDKTPVPFI